jgi:hypothetical protein
MMRREPALIVAALVAALQLVLGRVLEPGETVLLEQVANVALVLIGGLLIRRRVTSDATLEQAGLSRRAVESRAGHHG